MIRALSLPGRRQSWHKLHIAGVFWAEPAILRIPVVQVTDSPNGNRAAASLVLSNIATLCGYSISALLVRWYFARYGIFPAPFWLPSGVAFFAATLGSWRLAPGIFAGSLIVELTVFGAGNALEAMAISVSNTLAPVLAALLLRWRSGRGEPFGSIAGTYYFLAIGVIAHAALVASGGTASLLAAGTIAPERWSSVWLRWAVSDGGGTLIVAPLLMMHRAFMASAAELRRNWFEASVCVLVAIWSAMLLSYGGTGIQSVDAGSTFLIMLPLLWSAVRFPLPYAYGLMVVVTGVAIVATLSGHGILIELYKSCAVVTFTEMAVGFGTVVLLLGAALNEQRLAKEALRRANLDLERRVDIRTAELRESRRKLEQMAFFDTLTGLGNRRMFEDRFDIMSAMARRKGEKFALAMVDLDRFKEINDKYGHDAGDELLREASRRLVASVRQSDSVSRLGGDEFAVILAEAKDAAAIDRVCQRIVENFRPPIPFGAVEMRTSASIGVAVFPEHGATMSELYKSADLALYEAKHGGRNTWRWFATRLPEPEPQTDASKTQS